MVSNCFWTPTDQERSLTLSAHRTRVDVAEGGVLGAGLGGRAGEAVALEAAALVALASLQVGHLFLSRQKDSNKHRKHPALAGNS